MDSFFSCRLSQPRSGKTHQRTRLAQCGPVSLRQFYIVTYFTHRGFAG